MRRREFITLVGGAAATVPSLIGTRCVRAQPQRVSRVTLIMAYKAGDPEFEARITALREGLRQLGWADTIKVEAHYALGGNARREVDAVVRNAPDVIVTNGTPLTLAVEQSTKEIPIVFVNVTDPVATGLVTSMARPGGNATGFSNYEPAIAGKWLETLRELVPSLDRVLLLLNPDNPGSAGLQQAFENAASVRSIKLTSGPVRDAEDVKNTIAAFVREGTGCLATLPDGRTDSLRDVFLPLAIEYRLPAIYPFKYLAKEGGMMSYGIDAVSAVRQAATYVDRILRGARLPSCRFRTRQSSN